MWRGGEGKIAAAVDSAELEPVNSDEESAAPWIGAAAAAAAAAAAPGVGAAAAL